MKPKNKNAKNPDFAAPVKLHGVRPGSYAKSIDSANGSAKSKRTERPIAGSKKQ